ncbi:MAG: hypothetical protein J5755_05630, partial [Clostridia bacterium]|nr:hypothetical protein [Clostridia bacterium]
LKSACSSYKYTFGVLDEFAARASLHTARMTVRFLSNLFVFCAGFLCVPAQNAPCLAVRVELRRLHSAYKYTCGVLDAFVCRHLLPIRMVMI